MALPIDLAAYTPPSLHRVWAPRPVELAQPPAGRGSGGGGGPQAAAPPPVIPSAGPLIDGTTAASLLQIDLSWVEGGAGAFRQARAAGAYGLASMPEAAAVHRGVTYMYEEVSGLGHLPAEALADPAARQAHLRDQIGAARDAARREQRMSEAAGVEVRLAYDPNLGSAVALYPGDPGYDHVAGARTAFQRMAADLGKMGEQPRAFADLLRL